MEHRAQPATDPRSSTDPSEVDAGARVARLFSWTVVEGGGDPPELGAVGVCDDQSRAVGRVSDALRNAPDRAVGLVHQVTLNPVKFSYWYDDLVARAQIDPDSGAVIISERRPRGAWGPLDALFAEAAQAVADTPPPEALSTGLADVEGQGERRRGQS